MDPLIEIKTVPIEIQMKVTRAHLEYARGTAQVEISRDKGGLNIRSQPIQVNLDTFEARNSVMPTTATLIGPGRRAGCLPGHRRPGPEGPDDDGGPH